MRTFSCVLLSVKSRSALPHYLWQCCTPRRLELSLIIWSSQLRLLTWEVTPFCRACDTGMEHLACWHSQWCCSLLRDRSIPHMSRHQGARCHQQDWWHKSKLNFVGFAHHGTGTWRSLSSVGHSHGCTLQDLRSHLLLAQLWIEKDWLQRLHCHRCLTTWCKLGQSRWSAQQCC